MIKVSEKRRLEKTIKHIEANKHKELQYLISLDFEKLNKIKKHYYDSAKDAEEEGYKESAKVNFMKAMIIDEAIAVKTGNEEQAWDYLT